MNRFILFLIFFSAFWLCIKSQTTIDFTADTTSGCGSLDVNFTNTSTSLSGNERWFWTFGYKGIASQDKNPQKVKYDTSGVFNVTLTGKDIDNQELGTKTIQIKIRPKLNAYYRYKDTTGDRTYSFHSIKQEIDTGGIKYRYKWNFSTNTNLNLSSAGDTLPTVVRTFAEEGLYKVRLRIKDNLGCADSLTQTIGVADDLKAPNVFTPNNDGINDYFSILTKGNNVYALYIFSRNGQLIYKSESPTIIWDGNNFAGDPMESGTYYYSVETIKGQVKSKISGFIILAR